MPPRSPAQIGREEPARVRQERTLNKAAVQELLAAAVQSQADARLDALSGPRRLEAAYDGILFCGLAIFAAQGYRVSAPTGHHKLVFEGLAGELRFSQSTLDELEELLDRRNQVHGVFDRKVCRPQARTRLCAKGAGRD